MTQKNILLLGAGGTLVLAGIAALLFRHLGFEEMALPNSIDTFKSGLLFANQIKERRAPDAWLTIVNARLHSDSLQPEVFTYVYACKKPRPQVWMVMLDNPSRKAFQISDSPGFSAPSGAVERLLKADLSREPLEIADCLKIAETNGLGEFCRLVPSPNRYLIEMTFGSSETNTTWSFHGKGSDRPGSIVDLLIVMDAWSGAVIRTTLEKATNRSMP